MIAWQYIVKCMFTLTRMYLYLHTCFLVVVRSCFQARTALNSFGRWTPIASCEQNVVDEPRWLCPAGRFNELGRWSSLWERLVVLSSGFTLFAPCKAAVLVPSGYSSFSVCPVTKPLPFLHQAPLSVYLLLPKEPWKLCLIKQKP